MRSAEDWHQRFSHQAHWTEQVRAFLFNRADLKPGSAVIEIGCGTGAVLSRLPEQAKRFGLDIDMAYLRHAAAGVPPAALTCGDAHSLPFPDGAFDAACCHFLLLWVADPLEAIKEMSRICKPGGAVLVLAEPDYGGRIDHPEALQSLGQAQTNSLRAQGADPFMGRQVAGLMAAAGLVNLQIGIIGSQWEPPLSPHHQNSEWETLAHDLADQLPENQFNDYREVDRVAWEDGSRVLYVPTFYAYGEIE
jgi:SAM-dependent methyltransferase